MAAACNGTARKQKAIGNGILHKAFYPLSQKQCLFRGSIGDFSVTTNMNPPYRSIRCHFVDPEGEYRGGIFDSMVCDQADDMTIIFYDEDHPDRSAPASALMFHKLVWKDQISSAKRSAESAAGTESGMS
jgi:hypothetical protein